MSLQEYFYNSKESLIHADQRHKELLEVLSTEGWKFETKDGANLLLILTHEVVEESIEERERDASTYSEVNSEQ